MKVITKGFEGSETLAITKFVGDNLSTLFDLQKACSENQKIESVSFIGEKENEKLIFDKRFNLQDLVYNDFMKNYINGFVKSINHYIENEKKKIVVELVHKRVERTLIIRKEIVNRVRESKDSIKVSEYLDRIITQATNEKCEYFKINGVECERNEEKITLSLVKAITKNIREFIVIKNGDKFGFELNY